MTQSRQEGKRPPLGVHLVVDIERFEGPRLTVWRARIRWHDPLTGRRELIKRTHHSEEAASEWIERMQHTAKTGIDRGQTLAQYLDFIGDRWTRAIDPTSTYDPYSAGLRRRVVPMLGHLPVALITAGLVDRAIDRWETEFGRSTVKNTVAALVLVLDEAVRDGIITRNPAKDRARRRTVGRVVEGAGSVNPRDLALPDAATLQLLVLRAVTVGEHQSWGDVVTLLATTALRISEVAGLRVGDVDLQRGLLEVSRQIYPGRGGLVTKGDEGPAPPDGADHRAAGTHLEPPGRREAPGGPVAAGSSGRCDHHGDPARRDTMGRAGDRARSAGSGEARLAAHRLDLDG